jgi:hypothetical protein
VAGDWKGHIERGELEKMERRIAFSKIWVQKVDDGELDS